MAGLKTFWILIYSLLLLAACVPQTKQTECQGNEAFNAALRTCVPVVGGPSSFINIGTPSPAFTQTRHKADTTTLQFSISVSNPYNQTYTVAWERVFNGAPTAMCSNSLTCSFSAYLLGTTYGEVGTHILTAKILDGNGSVVDTHSFELKINELPKPIINSASLLPTQYAFTVTPGIASTEFKFNIKNNQATIALSHYYRTEWTIEQNGAILYTENDTFTNFSPSGTNLAYLGTSPTPYFNPSTLGVGSYIVRAVVKNDVPGEVVDEHQWNVTVSHPALKKINSRDIYFGSSNPNGVSAVSIAYNGIAYTSATTYNFIPQSIGATTFTLQGNYCVSVENGEGTYVGDNLGVKVNFLIDGGPQIYSGTTTALNSKICLSDAAATTLNNMLFSNTTTTGEQNHTLVARVFDLATNQEYTSSDMPGLGNYPVTWNFLVKPANAAPTISFAPTTTLTGLTSCTDIGNARNCTIPQDTPFTVGINALDDFYPTNSTDNSNQNKFTYSMTLMRNGTPLSTCTKTTANVADTAGPSLTGTTYTNEDFVGPEYHCGFVVPSYDATGPVNPDPNLNSYSVVINFSDVGSPIPGTTGATSNTIYYNLKVSEKNTAPVIVAQESTGGDTSSDSYLSKNNIPTVVNPGTPGQFFTEGDTLTFHVRVNDNERDNHRIHIYKCSTSTCDSTSPITSQLVTKSNNAPHTLTPIGFTIPEDFMPTNTGTTEPASANAFFKVVVTDCPSILTGTDTNNANCNTTATVNGPWWTTSAVSWWTPRFGTYEIFSAKVINKNPAPQFGGTPNPLTSATLTTMVGYPLTIYPGTVTDASTVAGENSISYQWYIDTDSTTENNYAPIVGATEQILRWTPSNGISGNVGIALCVSDGTTVNPFPATNVQLAPYNNPTGPNCLRRWVVNVKKNAVPVAYLNNDGTAGAAHVSESVAIWQDNTGTLADKKVIYSAYTAGTDMYIEKTVFDANGVIYNNDTTGFRTVKFPALPTGTAAATSIKDISLAGTASHLYIAYQAAESSNPGAPKIRVRRIDKRHGTTFGSKLDPSYPHPGKFGFAYDTASLLPTTNSPTNIDISGGSGTPVTVTFLNDLIAGNNILTNTVQTLAATPSSALNQLCAGPSPCTLDLNASKYSTFINNMADRLLQGVTAFNASPSTITTLYGSLNGAEYLDSNPTLSSYITGKLGKIMILSNNWYLPFVDKTTGSTLDYIRVLSASAADTAILNNSLTVGEVSYNSIGPVNYFTNDFNTANQIIIGSVNTINVASLNVFDLSGAPIPTPSTTTLFNGQPIFPTSLRFSGPVSGNNNYFVMGKVITNLSGPTYEWMFGKCDASLFCVNNNVTTATGVAYNAATESLLTVASLKDLSIESYPSVSGTSEARILINSGTGANTNLYTLRLRNDGNISCGLCVPLNVSGSGATSEEKLSPSKSVATTKIDIDMTIGTPGSSIHAPTENTRDVLFAVYPVQTGTGFYTPHMGIINVEAMTINSTDSTITGLSGSRPAFFGNN